MRTEKLVGGRYRLVERVGRGGMSVVWRGFDEVLGRSVAVKLLAHQFAGDAALRRRIRAEAQAAARLCHPHIAAVYDYGEARSQPYLVMELIEGRSLAASLAEGQTLPWRRAVSVGAQIAAALAYTHGIGLVHRDITPGNVMLTTAGVKLIDFGLSGVVGDPDTCLFGTPAYLAPERLAGEPVTAATDVYAVGVLLYCALAGELPWPAQTRTELVRAHRAVEPTPLPPVDGLPAEVAELCQRCLAKQPADRPAIAELARELNAALGDTPTVEFAPPPNARTMLLPGGPTREEPSRRRRVGMALGGAAAIVAAGLVWAGTQWTHEPPTNQAFATGAGLAAAPVGCSVVYRLQPGAGNGFVASVTVDNTGTESLAAWQLTFDLPDNQQLRGGTGSAWSQTGRTVTAQAPDQGVLKPGDTAQLSYSAGPLRLDAMPFPSRFAVNGTDCATTLLGPPAAANDKDEDHGKGKGKGKGKD